MNITYTVVVPVYNEEEVVIETLKRLVSVMNRMNEPYELLFVDDGSRDKTALILAEAAKADRRVRLLRFSRNFGHQPAITAGMDYARGSAVVIIDADLQDPPEVISDMAALWKQGYDVVYGKREARAGETAFKKWTASLFYRFLRGMTSVDIPVDTGDFRLMDRKVVEAMKSLHEKNRYVRGLVSWVGFNQTAVTYSRGARFAGVTKYPFKKMVRLAMDGIMSFSYKPLRLAVYLGLIIAFFSFVYLVVVLIQRAADHTVAGWASTMAVVLMTQGIVLMILGLMGEYLGRIYDEIKNRPIYIVKEEVAFHDEPDGKA